MGSITAVAVVALFVVHAALNEGGHHSFQDFLSQFACAIFAIFRAADSAAADEGGAEAVGRGVRPGREEPRRTKHLGRVADQGHEQFVQGFDELRRDDPLLGHVERGEHELDVRPCDIIQPATEWVGHIERGEYAGYVHVCQIVQPATKRVGHVECDRHE